MDCQCINSCALFFSKLLTKNYNNMFEFVKVIALLCLTSSPQQISNVLHYLLNALLVVLDLSAAFDCVDHHYTAVASWMHVWTLWTGSWLDTVLPRRTHSAGGLPGWHFAARLATVGCATRFHARATALSAIHCRTPWRHRNDDVCSRIVTTASPHSLTEWYWLSCCVTGLHFCRYIVGLSLFNFRGGLRKTHAGHGSKILTRFHLWREAPAGRAWLKVGLARDVLPQMGFGGITHGKFLRIWNVAGCINSIFSAAVCAKVKF